MPKRVRPHVNPLSIREEYAFAGFDNNHPILVDVGSCKGEFAAALVDKFPSKNFVLFEIRKPLLEKLELMFADKPNVKVFGGDAGRNFESILAPSIDRGILVEKVFINFPDPWFKERHKKRRFINPVFLSQAAKYVSPETDFIFQTDQKPLFEETVEVLEESPFSRLEYFDEPPYGVRTDWEVATTALGRDVWRMKFGLSRE